MTPHDAASSPPTSHNGTKPPPTFLTVEEAAAILRIGRTAAYGLTRQWRATGGVEGLPVVRVGRLLRVPVHELERLAGGAIDSPDLTVREEASNTAIPEPAAQRPASPPRTRRPRPVSDQRQPTLFSEAS